MFVFLILDISTKSFDFKANIIGAKLTVSVTIFEEAGFIQNDDEEIEVKKGMVKTDILISNWTFCDPCKMGNKTRTFGTKLQFTMTIKGKNSAPKKKSAKKARKVGPKRAPSYDLGGNVILILSKKVGFNSLIEVFKLHVFVYSKVLFNYVLDANGFCDP